MGSRIFHIAQVAGVEFKGGMNGDGPYIACDARYGDVALGICGLRKYRPAPASWRGREAKLGWWVVKYDDQARIDLTDFSDSEAQELSSEFGIVMFDDDDPLVSRDLRLDYFFTSPAWESLCRWCRERPKLAKQLRDAQVYLPSWYERAQTATTG
ncbi:conserved hypothetical protein [Cupriavidus taiwanensis]|uniref:hypothetical protein n=1 Tax=Cupriavidus taiwanensis TaxID=164546 RepID=UPI000E1534BB|nr:hypothetical protein [Cupriavidus taiwanensis]SPA23741.1 conserved hypothetical protein [Cupriavidus taiwanensis]